MFSVNAINFLMNINRDKLNVTFNLRIYVSVKVLQQRNKHDKNCNGIDRTQEQHAIVQPAS